MAQDVHEVHNMTGTDRLNEASITPTTSDIAPGTLEPSVSYSTHLALTVTCVVIFSLMFLFVYIQLWMVLYYKHKRRSYQTIFLFLCLVWAALRVTLFSFYFSKSDVMLANNLYPAVYWLLYSCPVVLQFTTLVLLVSFFSQVVIKAKYPQEVQKYRFRVRLICTLSVIVFTIVNVVCGIMAQVYIADPCEKAFISVGVRVVINGLLFVAHGISLSYWIFALNKIANARVLLESKGTNLWQSWLMCVFIVFVYVSRALYNIMALVFQHYLPDLGYGLINVTDQADLVSLDKGYNYVVYSFALLIWEILPTVIVTVFFRVQKPSNISTEPSFDDMSYRQQQSFFDNPKRYDSEEDLSNNRYASDSYSASNRGNMHAINSSSGSGVASPRNRPGSYDPRLVRSTSTRSYAEPQYNGT